ncbi:MAG: DUF4920 domain-containing protein [Bacteroidales bacterium]
MKLNHIWVLIIFGVLLGCNSQDTKTKDNSISKNEPGHYGAKVQAEKAITAEQLKARLANSDSIRVTMESVIVANCQHSGCWMDLDFGDDEMIRVTFRDEEFTIPLDSKGKTAIVEGYAKKDFIPVDLLKHYAEDDGKSKEEIDAITEPQPAYTFEAAGVIIKD